MHCLFFLGGGGLLYFFYDMLSADAYKNCKEYGVVLESCIPWQSQGALADKGEHTLQISLKNMCFIDRTLSQSSCFYFQAFVLVSINNKVRPVLNQLARIVRLLSEVKVCSERVKVHSSFIHIFIFSHCFYYSHTKVQQQSLQCCVVLPSYICEHVYIVYED